MRDGTTLYDLYDELIVTYNEIKKEVRRRDPREYERWKAGGFLIDGDIISMYPDLGAVVAKLGDEVDSESDDD